MAAFLFSCNQKKPDKAISYSSPNKEKIEVTLIGEVLTRRSYADIQFMDDEKEIDKHIAKQEKSNPIANNNFSVADSFLVAQFERLGLIKNNEFLLSRFKPQTKPENEFIDSLGHKGSIKFFNDVSGEHTQFKLFYLKDSIDIDTKAIPLQKLDYAFLDVIPGGNKELVFLDDYYIMNGDNFILKVYEIKFR